MRRFRLATRRLVLRPVRLSDAPGFFDSGRREEVARAAGFPTQKSLAQTRRYLRGESAEWASRAPRRLTFSITRRGDGAWLGGISLTWAHRGVGQLGYALHPGHWGRGFASEAARKVVDWAIRVCGAHRVQATTWVGNRRSMAVLRRVGLRREGRLRGYLRRGDWIRDEHIWGATRADWLSRAARRGRTRTSER